MAANQKNKSSGNNLLTVMLLVVVGISVFSLYAVFIPVIGLMPGLIALVVDPHKGKYGSKIVLSYNTLAVVQYMIPVFILGIGQDADNAAYRIVSNPRTWLIIYLAAAFGWCIYLAVPRVCLWVARVQNQIVLRTLQTELEEIMQNWGEQAVEQPSIKKIITASPESQATDEIT